MPTLLKSGTLSQCVVAYYYSTVKKLGRKIKTHDGIYHIWKLIAVFCFLILVPSASFGPGKNIEKLRGPGKRSFLKVRVSLASR